MENFDLYGKLLANAALLPDPEKETLLIYQRLAENLDYVFIKAKNFLAIGSEDKKRIEELNILKRSVDRIEYDKKVIYVIIHKIVKP